MVQRGQFLLRALVRYSSVLELYRERIDRLNVYPVPDGDTGANMYFTARASSELIEESGWLTGTGEIGELGFRDIAKAALLGARGNSGVILSQVISAFCEVFGSKPAQWVTGEDLVHALSVAGRRARDAVLNPVEGTILTVIADVAKAGAQLLASSAALVDLALGLFNAAEASLTRTPELLSQLRKAGVVDSGGAGFVVLIAAICQILDVPGFSEVPTFGFERVVPAPPSVGTPASLPAQIAYEIGPRYEVMYLLESNPSAVDGFREVWAGLGDSIVVVGQDGIYNCHIHTDDIGGSIEAGIGAGKPSRIRVTDLADQVIEERWVLEADGAGAPNPYSGASVVPPETSVVVIANGDGISRIFRSLGVQRIVLGGQSMNPSTEEILRAIAEVPSANVIVLPNNTNVTPVATLAAQLSGKNVMVIPTSGIVEGLSALVEFDPMVDIQQNVLAMTRSAKRVTVAEITRAVRDYESEIGQVSTGDYIGLSRSGLVSISASLAQSVIEAISALISPGSEIVTIIEGEGSLAGVTREITEWLKTHHLGVEVEIHHGAQPLYPYLIGIE